MLRFFQIVRKIHALDRKQLAFEFRFFRMKLLHENNRYFVIKFYFLTLEGLEYIYPVYKH